MKYDVVEEERYMREEAKKMPEYKELNFKIGDSVYATLHKKEYPSVCGDNEQKTIECVVEDIIKLLKLDFTPILIVIVKNGNDLFKINDWRKDISIKKH